MPTQDTGCRRVVWLSMMSDRLAKTSCELTGWLQVLWKLKGQVFSLSVVTPRSWGV
jgi:hypothetical protein